MADTLLSIVTKACGRMGIDAPATIVGNTMDPTAVQMLALAIEEGEELVRAGNWSALTIEGASIALVSGQETYPLPVDFDRLVGDTQWDRTNRWRTLGPDDPQMARERREGIVPFGPRRALRQVGSNLTVWPVPGPGDAGALIAFDYVSNAYSATAAGARQPAWAADTDIPMLRADLMVLGLKWRWRFAEGFEASVLRADYEKAVRLALSRDQGGGETIDLRGSRCGERGNADDVFARGPSVGLSTDSGFGIAID